jgi:hypothetical protein
MLLGTFPANASLGPTVAHRAFHWDTCIGWCRTAVCVAFKAVVVVFRLALAWAAALLLPPLGHLDCGSGRGKGWVSGRGYVVLEKGST